MAARRYALALTTAVAGFALTAGPASAAVLQAHITTSFGAASIAKNGNTTISFAVSNPNPGGGLSNIGFADTLPSGLEFAVAVVGSNDCGGTLTVTITTMTLSGAALGGGQLCVVSGYEVIGTTAGEKNNSVTVTSSAGTGNTAQATLDVFAPPEPATFFTDALGGGSPDWINVGDTATVDIGVDNPNTFAPLTGVGLTDTLPSGLVVANPNGVTTGGSCAASAISAVPGSHTITLSGVTLAAGPTDPNATCAAVVAVTGVADGLQMNSTGTVTSNEGGFAAAVEASIGVFAPGPRIYWGATLNAAAAGLVQFAKLDGSVAGTLAKHAGSGGQEGTAIDAAAGRIYWIDAANLKVRWSSLDDSTQGELSRGNAPMTSPRGLAIDPAAGLLYWANDGGTSMISYAHLDGSGGGQLDVTGATPGVAAGPAIDLAQHRLYWADQSANKISYANLDGSGGGGDLLTPGATVNSPSSVTIDEAAGRIYWANTGPASISYAALDGSGGANLIAAGPTLVTPWGIAVDPTTSTVYWTNQTTTGPIGYLVLGGAASTLTTPGLTPTGPAYPSLLYPPLAVGTTHIAGGGTPGTLLTCSATWAPDVLGSFLYRVPQTLAYQWQRNGTDIPGANGATLAAAVTGAYTCRVTARNAAGSALESSGGSHLVATLSAVKITSPTAPFQLSNHIVVRYSATDSAGASVVSYDVEYERARWNLPFGPWTLVTPASGTPSTSTTITAAAGYEYCMRVRAHDTAHNQTPWVATPCTAIPLDDRSLSLVNKLWLRTTSTGAYDGTLTTTSQKGAELQVVGAQVARVALVVTVCPTCGHVGIYIGGTLWDVVNTFATKSRKEVLFLTGVFKLRTTAIVLRAMDASRAVLIDGLGVARK